MMIRFQKHYRGLSWRLLTRCRYPQRTSRPASQSVDEALFWKSDVASLDDRMGSHVITTGRLPEFLEHTDCSPHPRVSTVTNENQLLRHYTEIMRL